MHLMILSQYLQISIDAISLRGSLAADAIVRILDAFVLGPTAWTVTYFPICPRSMENTHAELANVKFETFPSRLRAELAPDGMGRQEGMVRMLEDLGRRRRNSAVALRVESIAAGNGQVGDRSAVTGAAPYRHAEGFACTAILGAVKDGKRFAVGERA